MPTGHYARKPRSAYARRMGEDYVELDIKMRLSGDLAEACIYHALRLKREPVSLVADILEKVLGENLVDAVLDE